MFGITPSTGYTSDQRERPAYIELALHRLTTVMLDRLQSHTPIHVHPTKAAPRILLNLKEIMDQIVNDPALTIVETNPPLPRGVVKHFGGRLSDLVAASQDLRKLKTVIQKYVDNIAASIENPLLIGDTLTQLGRSINPNIRFKTVYKNEKSANIQTLQVGQHHSSDCGRLLICHEHTDCDLLEQFLHGVERTARAVIAEPASIDYRHQVASLAHDPSSATHRFLNFFEDSLARVRLQFARRLMMQLIAGQPKSLLVEYVQRIEWLISAVESGQFDGRLDLSAIFGERSGQIDLADELASSEFYACLPLWPEWTTQMNETRTEQHTAWRLERDIAWRFRVNGRHPEDQQPAFESRIQRLADERLCLSAWNEPGFDITTARLTKRALAQWIFLYCIAHPEAGNTQTDYLAFVQARWEYLKRLRPGADGLVALQQEWLQWRVLLLGSGAQRIRQATKLFTQRLRSQTALLPEHLIQKYTLSCQTSVLDTIQIEARQDPIQTTGDIAEERQRWFESIWVTAGEQPPSGALLSFVVTMKGKQLGLRETDALNSIPMRRNIERPVLPVLLRPYMQATTEPPSDKDPTKALRVQPSIEIYYSQNALNASRPEQRSMAALCFALLTYLLIDAIRNAITVQNSDNTIARHAMPILLLRLHTSAADTEQADTKKSNVSQALYAAVAAVELALARDGSVRTQGLIFTPNAAQDQNFLYRMQGTLAACTAGLPLRFEWPGALQRLAIITVAARPCTERDSDHTLEHADWLLVSRAYLIQRQIKAPQHAQMVLMGMRSRITDGDPPKNAADLIGEWVNELTEQGQARDILVIHHHFGARHIGAAAKRRAFWSAAPVQARLRQYLPDDTYLYSLQRDLVPITRLNNRPDHVSAYEITELNDQPDWQHGARDLRPIYTFATLHIVGGDAAARPQSGLCTYFQITDDGFDQAYHERVRARLMGVDDSNVRASLTAGLRMVHFFESEAQMRGSHTLWRPTLDPYSWVKPIGYDEAGEVLYSVQGGKRYLSLAATLTRVVECLDGTPDVKTTAG